MGGRGGKKDGAEGLWRKKTAREEVSRAVLGFVADQIRSAETKKTHSTRAHEAFTTASIVASSSWPFEKAWFVLTLPPL